MNRATLKGLKEVLKSAKGKPHMAAVFIHQDDGSMALHCYRFGLGTGKFDEAVDLLQVNLEEERAKLEG